MFPGLPSPILGSIERGVAMRRFRMALSEGSLLCRAGTIVLATMVVMAGFSLSSPRSARAAGGCRVVDAAAQDVGTLDLAVERHGMRELHRIRWTTQDDATLSCDEGDPRDGSIVRMTAAGEIAIHWDPIDGCDGRTYGNEAVRLGDFGDFAVKLRGTAAAGEDSTRCVIDIAGHGMTGGVRFSIAQRAFYDVRTAYTIILLDGRIAE